MALEIVKYGNQALKQEAQPVGEITDDIRALADSMLRTMYAASGLGLAAEQVGRTESLVVIDVPKEAEYPECADLNDDIEMPLVLVDPVILESEGSMRRSEGCLSFPDVYVHVSRARTVTFQYTNLQGERITATAHGLLARAVQHELDHLKGVLLVDRMSSTQRMANAGKLRRIRQTA